MFGSRSQRLGGILDKLTKRGALREGRRRGDARGSRGPDRGRRRARRGARVHRAVKGRAVGQDVIRSVTPGQMVVKIVHDQLVETLG